MAQMKRVSKLEYDLLMAGAKRRARIHLEKKAEASGNITERHRILIPQGSDAEWEFYALHDRLVSPTAPDVAEDEERAILYVGTASDDVLSGCYRDSGLTKDEVRTAGVNRPTIVDPVTFEAAIPEPPPPEVPEGEIAFGVMPTADSAASLTPGSDYATGYINNAWWKGAPECVGLCMRKWYADGWGRLAATVEESGGVWMTCDPVLFFRVPAGDYSFATLAFTLDYNLGDDPVPCELHVAQYDHATFADEGWIEDWVLNPPGTSVGANGYFDPPADRIIDSAPIRIPLIPDTGDGYITNESGEILNLAGVLSGGGTFMLKFEQTDDTFEYYRDFAELYLHLWD